MATSSSRSLAALLLVLVVGCSSTETAEQPDAADSPRPTPSETSPSATGPEASCAEPGAPPKAGRKPRVTCVWPDADAYILCSNRTQRKPLTFRWSSSGANRAFLAEGVVADAEGSSFTGKQPATGAYGADTGVDLVYSCQNNRVDYTLTVKGPGGSATRTFTLFTRIS